MLSLSPSARHNIFIFNNKRLISRKRSDKALILVHVMCSCCILKCARVELKNVSVCLSVLITACVSVSEFLKILQVNSNNQRARLGWSQASVERLTRIQGCRQQHTNRAKFAIILWIHYSSGKLFHNVTTPYHDNIFCFNIDSTSTSTFSTRTGWSCFCHFLIYIFFPSINLT